MSLDQSYSTVFCGVLACTCGCICTYVYSSLSILQIRWNGCHATANALSSKMLLEHFSVDELIATLTKTLYTCKNFKVGYKVMRMVKIRKNVRMYVLTVCV